MASDSTGQQEMLTIRKPEKKNNVRNSSLVPMKTGDNQQRGTWSNKIEFILSFLSFAVGLGNVWRFPYVCYRNGAGAFLIPFIVMLFVMGIPLVYLELSFGQFASSGVVTIWKASPIFQGVGWAMFIVSVLIAIYYNMIIAYILYYLFASFKSVLPWSLCGEWSTSACYEDTHEKQKCITIGGVWCKNDCFTNVTQNETFFGNCTERNFISPSDDYFHNFALEITEGIHDLGSIKWELALCLLLAWFLVCFCLAKGITSGGKAAYFTAFFPYIILTILLVRGLTLEGSTKGIIYFFKPQWNKLADSKVWGDAAVQIFFSLAPGWGGLITLGSYNKYHNNCFLDAVIVSVMDCVTSIFAGLVIFSIIGYMSEELGKDVSDVAAEGAGLAFIVYPEVVTKLPISQLWSVLFFAMLVTLGIGTQMTIVTTVHTTLLDRYPSIFRRNTKTRFMLLIGISIVCYIIGLVFASQGGMYVLQLFDNYAATYSLLVIGLVESLALSWVYGGERFLTDIESMLGHRPGKLWLILWKCIVPCAIFGVLLFTWIDLQPSSYNIIVFPSWADGIGWLISLSSILAIPIVAIYLVADRKRRHGGSILECIKFLSRPEPGWGPVQKENRAVRTALEQLPRSNYKRVVLHQQNWNQE